MALLILASVFAVSFLVALGAVGISRKWLPADAVATLGGGAQDDQPLLLRGETLSAISFWDRLLGRFDYVDILKSRLAEAGLRWSVGRLTSMMLLSGTLVLALLFRFGWIGTLPSAILAGLAALAPYGYVLRKRSVRFIRFEDQFPDALDSLSRALRAGHPLNAGLEMLALEFPPPLSLEMRRTVDELKLGRSWQQALDNMATRMPLVEVNVFASAVRLQSRTGGKLNEVLSRLSETLRESAALRGEVRAIAAHGRMTGMLLTVLPLFIAGMMYYVNPSYLGYLWADEDGRDLVGVAVCALVAAHLVIRRMVDIRL